MAKSPKGETRETIERILKLVDDPMLDQRSDSFIPYIKTLQNHLGVFEDGVLGPELVHRVVGLSDDELKKMLSEPQLDDTDSAAKETKNKKPGTSKPYADLPTEILKFFSHDALQLLPDSKPALISTIVDTKATHFTLQVTIDRDAVTRWLNLFREVAENDLADLEHVIRDYRVLLPIYLAEPPETSEHSLELMKYCFDQSIPLMRIARYGNVGEDSFNLEIMSPKHDTPTEYELSAESIDELADHVLLMHPDLVFEGSDVELMAEVIGENHADIYFPEMEVVERAGQWKRNVAGWLNASQTPTTGQGEISFSGFVSDDINRADALGLERDVKALCSIIASREVNPPLSIGLFGDWGTGKSFFIKEMRSCIDKMTAKAAAAETGFRQGEDVEEPDYWSNIAQIDFNAWHFEDADLWASFVVHIFDSLSTYMDEGLTEIDEVVEKRRQLFRALQEMQKGERALEAEVEQARIRQTRAREELEAANIKLEDARQRVREFSFENIRQTVFQEMLGKKPEFKKLLGELGVTKLGKDAEEVREQIVALKKDSESIAHEATLLIRKILTPMGLVVLTTLVVATFVWPLLLEHIDTLAASPVWQEAVKLGGHIVMWGGGAITAVQKWLVPVRGKIELAMEHFTELEENSEKRVETEKAKASEAKENLDTLIKAREKSELKLQKAIADREEVEQEIDDIKNGKLLFSFLEEKSSSTLYRNKLGLVTSIRRDFKRLSDILSDQATRKRAEWKEQPPVSDRSLADPEQGRRSIDRIVLYIDDLDRCTPERVVEVLRAIHLLLAFRLFVVVVAVDSRWLLNSIQRTLKNVHIGAPERSETGKERYEPLLTVEALKATPQNYLEKIFQIPFTLKPISRQGMKDLLYQLAAPVVSKYDHDGSPEARAEAGSQDLDGFKNDASNAKQPGSEGEQAKSTEAASSIKQATSAEPRPEQDSLNLRPSGNAIEVEPYDNVELNVPDSHFYRHEVDRMESAWVVMDTPRAVNRFVNTYRILRSMVTQAQRGEFFNQHTGEYQAAIFLLTVLIGYPKLSEAIFRAIEDCSAANDTKALETLPMKFTREEDQIQLSVVVGLFRETYDRLGQRISPFAKWMPRVARFSFRPLNIGFLGKAED